MKKIYEIFNYKNVKISSIGILSILSVFSIFIMMFIFPLLGDDLLHGKVGIGIHFMQIVNGRYLGNLFGINLSSSLILRILIKSTIFISIIFLIKKIIKEKSLLYYLIILSFFLFMPKEIFRQVIVNSSGFANYVIPVIGVLIIIYIHFNEKEIILKWYNYILFLSLGVINSLFVEHITIFNIILSMYFIIFSYMKNKKINKIYIFYLIGSVIGSYLMFSNPIYLSSFNGTDDYRTLSTTLSGIFGKLFIIVNDAFYINYAINFILSILMIILMKKQIVSKKNFIYKMFASIIIFFAVYQLLKLLNPSWQIFANYQFENYFSGFITLLYIGIVFITILLSNLNKNQKYKLLFYIICYLAVLSPLLFVNPIGPRCYFIGYVFLILLVVNLIKIFETKNYFKYKWAIRFIIPIIIIIQFIFYFTIYGKIYIESEKRINFIKTEISKGNKEINFDALPFPDYLHGVEICPEYNELVFRIHYDIEEDIVFIKEGC